MARAYSKIAFTQSVRKLQAHYGSAGAYSKFLAPEAPARDVLTNTEAEFIIERDGFYQATVSETGWPYVQFRGGPPGFVRPLDNRTLAYADFRDNRQYISTGNMMSNDKIALFFMDYANRRRLKLYGRARIITAEDDPKFVQQLHNPNYHATPERAVVIKIAGLDWNCPQHIPERFTQPQIEHAIAPMREQLAALEKENANLKRKLAAGGGA